MLAAVEAWVKRDHAQEEKTWLARLDHISKKVAGIDTVTTSIREPTGLDNRSASLTISWDPAKLVITGEEVAEDFAKTKPRIALGGRTDTAAGSTSIAINAAMMQPGNEKVVADRVYEILTRKHSPKSTEMKAPGANLSGVWQVDVAFYAGKSQHTLFINSQEGNWVQGSHKSDYTMQDLSGTIEENEVKLMSVYSAPGDSITFTFAGTLSGDSISGTLFMGEYRQAGFMAKRHSYTPKRVPVSVPNHGRRSGNAW